LAHSPTPAQSGQFVASLSTHPTAGGAAAEGARVGADVAGATGDCGAALGMAVGANDGGDVGAREGRNVGAAEGGCDGLKLGTSVGA